MRSAWATTHSVNLDEGRTDLPTLMARAAGGETILLTEAAEPMARLGPARRAPAEPARRRLALLAGPFTVPEDFDRMG